METGKPTFWVMLAILLLMSVISTTATTFPAGGVVVSRDLISPVSTDLNFTVTLTVDVNESNLPVSVGLTEYYPPGWIVSDISVSGIDMGDRIEWVCSALTSCHVEDQNITYTVHVPVSASGVYIFNGTIYSMGEFYLIDGDTELTILEWEPVVNVSRDLPESTYSGSNFVVTLTMNVDESNLPDSVGLTEYYPSGWNVSDISVSGIDMGDRIEWVCSALTSCHVEDQDITYTISAPEGVNGTYDFIGNLYYQGVYSDITGDTGLSVLAACELLGNYPPCGEVSLSEVINLINLWVAGEAELSDVVTLINVWAG